MVDSTIFWVFATLAITGALGTVFHRSIVYAALFLIVVFLSIAGIFLLNNADFLAIAQTIVYAVGLTIILLFAIMFTGDRQFVYEKSQRGPLIAMGIVSLYTLGMLIKAVAYPFASQALTPTVIGELRVNGSTLDLGKKMFSTLALPFEVSSVLLLVAMVGAIVLAKKSFEDEEPARIKYALDTRSALTDIAQSKLDVYEAMERDPSAVIASTSAKKLDESEPEAETVEELSEETEDVVGAK